MFVALKRVKYMNINVKILFCEKCNLYLLVFIWYISVILWILFIIITTLKKRNQDEHQYQTTWSQQTYYLWIHGSTNQRFLCFLDIRIISTFYTMDGTTKGQSMPISPELLNEWWGAYPGFIKNYRGHHEDIWGPHVYPNVR